MSIKISANFENVDFASTALSKIRKSNTGLKELRIKNKKGFDNQKPHTLAALSYYSQSPFDGVEYSPGSMIPNGALPIAFVDSNNYDVGVDNIDKTQSVMVEIQADKFNCDKICQQIRSNGGYDVRILK